MEPSERPELEQIEKLLDVIEQLCRPLVQADVQELAMKLDAATQHILNLNEAILDVPAGNGSL